MFIIKNLFLTKFPKRLSLITLIKSLQFSFTERRTRLVTFKTDQ